MKQVSPAFRLGTGRACATKIIPSHPPQRGPLSLEVGENERRSWPGYSDWDWQSTWSFSLPGCNSPIFRLCLRWPSTPDPGNVSAHFPRETSQRTAADRQGETAKEGAQEQRGSSRSQGLSRCSKRASSARRCQTGRPLRVWRCLRREANPGISPVHGSSPDSGGGASV